MGALAINGSFKEILQKIVNYQTNVAVIPSETSLLIVFGEQEKVRILQFSPGSTNELTFIQNITVTNPIHVALWRQHQSVYLSIVDQSTETSTGTPKTSNIKIYKWLGKHFDQIQIIELKGIKKVVPFNIHGTLYLAAVKHDLEMGHKSYSEIWKFDVHLMIFMPFQQLFTNGCNDIKYFRAKLHGETHHFLVVVHFFNDTEKSANDLETKSVIYIYENDYFIPFESLETNVLEWQPIHDMQDNTALFGLTSESLRSFQYDGWNFLENTVKFNNSHQWDIKAVHSYTIQNEEVLACDHCNSTIVYSINFTSSNFLKDKYLELLSWCNETFSLIQEPLPLLSQESSLLSMSRGDQEISMDEDQTPQQSAAFTKSEETLYSIENSLEGIIFSDNNLTILEGNFEVDTINFNQNASIDSVYISSINDINIDELLENVLNIQEGFEWNNNMEIEELVVNNEFKVNIFNENPIESYIMLNNDSVIKNLTIHGTATFERDLKVENVLNSIEITESNLLLKEGNQRFEGNLNIEKVTIEKLISKLEDSLPNTQEKISYIKHLTVEDLQIGGLLNRVYIPSLAKHALKKVGNQILNTTFTFESLEVSNLLSKNVRLTDFIFTNSGEYDISNSVEFLQPLKVKYLEVVDHLNNISVSDEGTLDLLLSESNDVQYITGKKTFEHDLIVTNSIFQHDYINNSQLQRINPVKIYENSFEVNGDLEINGQMSVIKKIKMNDIKTFTENNSFEEIMEYGIKLSDHEIPVHLTFLQTLETNDIITDKINDLNPNQWLQENDELQSVLGQKRFLGDLNLDGPMTAYKINNIDIQELENSSLKINGDQEILGEFQVDTIIAPEVIENNVSEFKTLVMKGDLALEHINTTILQVNGLINSIDVTKFFKNLVKSDNTDFKIMGRKTFKELHVENLIITEPSHDIPQLLRQVINNNIKINKDLDLFKNISISHLKYGGTLNNITPKDFNEMMNLYSDEEDIFIKSNMEYDHFIVVGDVFIDDECINGKNITSIEKDTVKNNEDHEFSKITIGDTIFAHKNVHLHGNIENLDLDNIVISNMNESVTIEDKIYNGKINVTGILNIPDTFNGIDLKKFCAFSNGNNNFNNLQVEGDVMFSKCPQILNVNGLNIKNLLKTVWFVDKPVKLLRNLYVNYVTFNNSVVVQTYVDGTNLSLLSKNYLSKSKDQLISASYSFTKVTFTNISAPSLTTNLINGISLENKLKNIILQNKTQIFENFTVFEQVSADEISGNFTLNKMNLTTEIMRYDQENIVTGKKTFENLHVDVLNLRHDIKIQNVEILNFLDNVVLRKGSYNIIGKKILNNATFKKGLSLRGKLNDDYFTDKTVMLDNVAQIITGKKTFINQKNSKLKSVRISGLVNGIDLKTLILNKTDNSNANSEMIFNGPIVLKNINIAKYKNINVTLLMEKMNNLRDLSIYKNRFYKLLDASSAIESSVQNQSTTFKYYKEVLEITNVDDIFGLTCADGVFRIVSITLQNSTCSFKTYEWDSRVTNFVLTGEYIELQMNQNIQFVQEVSFAGKQYIYMQHVNNDNKDYSGSLMEVVNSSNVSKVITIDKMEIDSLLAFRHPNKSVPCLASISHKLHKVSIMCYVEERFRWDQTISLPGVYEGAVIESSDSVFLIFTMVRKGLSQEPSVIIFKGTNETSDFEMFQTIFEGSDLNGLAAATISDVPYIALSYGSHLSTMEPGWITIKKINITKNLFTTWQHIPVTAPLKVEFITKATFEPLLLVPTSDPNAPLQIYKYDGVAGFKRVIKGTSLPINAKIKIISNGHFLAVLQKKKKRGIILGGVVKGSLNRLP
ncbi:hypothetical protein ABEB36_004033 [Hypothenemus hampei]|uniref:Uncharacterized protein n=1 Tax=Hypothenemus hampei TaxID=57062 RepID=A0ABD1F5Q6_HYPHA